MRIAVLLACLSLSACAVVPQNTVPPASSPPPTNAALPSAKQAADNFIAVVKRVEPVAESTCRNRTTGENCDYIILVDSRAELPPNAFQTVDDDGRPLIVFTVSLIAEARNRDELAFILGHEAAHHIEGHLPKQQDSALRGALAAGILARIGGASEAIVERAVQVGAEIGARTYSKEFELEADALGALIAHRAGFDARAGARYFTRIADPGNRFLGTHPPNAQRIQTVDAVVSGL